jgi:hypothetical protein
MSSDAGNIIPSQAKFVKYIQIIIFYKLSSILQNTIIKNINAFPVLSYFAKENTAKARRGRQKRRVLLPALRRVTLFGQF